MAEYPPLRRPSRLCAALRPLRGARRTRGPVNPCSASGTPSYTWSVDRWGNGVRQNGSATTTVTAPNNQLAGSRYDAAGNVMQDELGNQYTYDAENRLISFTQAAALGGGTSTCEYDADGKRVRRTINGSAPVEYQFVKAGAQIPSRRLKTPRVGARKKLTTRPPKKNTSTRLNRPSAS